MDIVISLLPERQEFGPYNCQGSKHPASTCMSPGFDFFGI
jgi:hypothetical protein